MFTVVFDSGGFDNRTEHYSQLNFVEKWFEIPPKFIHNIRITTQVWYETTCILIMWERRVSPEIPIKYQMQLWLNFISITLAMFKCIQTNSVSFKFIILSRFQIYIRRNVNIFDYMNIWGFK